MFFHYLLNFGQNEILKAWKSQNSQEKEFQFILSKLEEAIIIKDTDDNSISYSNKKGTNILDNIALRQGNTDNSLLFQMFELQKIQNYKSNVHLEDTNQNNTTSQNPMYSLENFFNMSDADLLEKVFMFSIESYDSSEYAV